MFETRPGAAILQGQDVKQDGRVFMRHPFASISASLIQKLGKPGTSSAARAENATGTDFPLEFCFHKKPCPQLAGLGVRAKKILGLKNINIYSLGLYVDGGAFKHKLGHKFKHADPASLASDQALFDGLINDSTIEKTLRLVIAFGSLKRGQFVDALEERLAPPLKKAGQTAALEAFKHQFDTVEFKKGLEIAFTQSGSDLVTRIDGQEVGRLANPALSHALLDIYLGADPVSPDFKASTGATLAAALH